MGIQVHRSGSFIEATQKTKKGKISFFMRDVRGTISWPTSSSPMYFSIFGQKVESDSKGKFPLMLLFEFSAEGPTEVLRKLLEKTRTFSCTQFYADLRSEHRELYGLFNELRRYHGSPNIRLFPARLPGSFQIGVRLVKEWARSLEIPEGTVLRDELRRFSKDDLQVGQASDHFPAVNALRLLLSSLEFKPWNTPGPFRGTSQREDARGWT
jgi:hypothetical protein